MLQAVTSTSSYPGLAPKTLFSASLLIRPPHRLLHSPLTPRHVHFALHVKHGPASLPPFSSQKTELPKPPLIKRRPPRFKPVFPEHQHRQHKPKHLLALRRRLRNQSREKEQEWLKCVSVQLGRLESSTLVKSVSIYPFFFIPRLQNIKCSCSYITLLARASSLSKPLLSRSLRVQQSKLAPACSLDLTTPYFLLLRHIVFQKSSELASSPIFIIFGASHRSSLCGGVFQISTITRLIYQAHS